MDIGVSWTDFKQLIGTGTTFRYFNVNDGYMLLASDGSITFLCQLPQDGGSDQTEFEQNYISLANKTNPPMSNFLSNQLELLNNLTEEIKKIKLILIQIGNLKDSDFE